MDEYKNSISNYYFHKHQGFKKCDECDTDIIFEETKHTLLYSCGKNDNSKCGIKIKIQFILL